MLAVRKTGLRAVAPARNADIAAPRKGMVVGDSKLVMSPMALSTMYFCLVPLINPLMLTAFLGAALFGLNIGCIASSTVWIRWPRAVFGRFRERPMECKSTNALKT